ncbi:hypothetical protein SDC9_120389 [bioreactor metagenome]|uniref:Uncharacterized protein n=1 Tax=bioreactor metagenome TaxID=1076179 RepID=A0A645C6Y7_9ZZZZ|nr:hypothetical protein [Anaerotignum propionicum]MEA5057678.1 hypothetical protein [Anaerotignum propionicum]
MGRGIALTIFAVIFAIGLILAILPHEEIAVFIAKQKFLVATIAAIFDNAYHGWVVALPLEKREFGTKLAVTRNALSFIFSIVIAVMMRVIL